MRLSQRPRSKRWQNTACEGAELKKAERAMAASVPRLCRSAARSAPSAPSSNVCPQLPSLDGFNLETSNTEDCLYLNVFTQVGYRESTAAVRSWSGLTAAALSPARPTITIPDQHLALLSPLGWERVNLTRGYIWSAEQPGTENSARSG